MNFKHFLRESFHHRSNLSRDQTIISKQIISWTSLRWRAECFLHTDISPIMFMRNFWTIVTVKYFSSEPQIGVTVRNLKIRYHDSREQFKIRSASIRGGKWNFYSLNDSSKGKTFKFVLLCERRLWFQASSNIFSTTFWGQYVPQNIYLLEYLSGTR